MISTIMGNTAVRLLQDNLLDNHKNHILHDFHHFISVFT